MPGPHTPPGLRNALAGFPEAFESMDPEEARLRLAAAFQIARTGRIQHAKGRRPTEPGVMNMTGVLACLTAPLPVVLETAAKLELPRPDRDPYGDSL